MAVLYYFNGRGLGELIRITLCAAKVQFEEGIIRTREDFLKLKDGGKLLFGQVPLLEIDGKNIVQQRAALNYIAEKQGLFGKNADEKCRIQMLFEGARDLQTAFMAFGFRGTDEEILKAASDKTLPKYLPIFEKELEGSSSGFIVGDNMSLADCALFEGLLSCLDYFGEDVLASYPNLQKFVGKMKADDGIQLFLKSYRKQRNSDDYIKEVKTCLAM